MTKNARGEYVIEIRDARLRGGRMSITSRATSKPAWRRRDTAVRKLLDLGEIELIERLRKRGGLSIEDVERAVDAGDIDALRGVVGDDLTLGAAVKRLLDHVRANRRASTLAVYQGVTTALLGKFGTDTPINRIGRDQLEDWLDAPQQHLNGNAWAPNTRKQRRAVLSRLFRRELWRADDFADRHGTAPALRRNPVQRIDPPRVEATRVEFLRPPQWRRLAKTNVGQPVLAALGLGCLAGLRIGEVAHLRTGIDVELGKQPVIHVQPREGEYAWRPKTAQSIRDIPIGEVPELVDMLREHIRLGFAGERYLFRAPWADDPLTTETLRAWTRDAFARAKLPYGRRAEALTNHSLRHTFISWLVQQDVSLKKIAMLAGTSVEMIDRVYGHLADRDLERAMARLAERGRER